MSYEEYSYTWGAHSRRELETCHPDLVTLANAILPFHDCKVQEGHRPQEEQDLHFLESRSQVKWPNGKHNKTPSDAIHLLPFVDGRFVGWEGKEAMHSWYAFCGLVIGASIALHKAGMISRKIRWGGDWDSDWNFREHKLRDLGHWELE